MPTKLTLLLLLAFTALPTSAQTHQLVPVQIGAPGQEVSVHELRFYKIRTAHAMMRGLEELCGTPNQVLDGRYQENVKEYLWHAVELPNKQTYSLMASGTETGQDYFACVMVFDHKGRDALNANHPDQDYLVDYFVTLMD